ncbi:vWA domain-containing protein [Corynebacterium cystitidis]
MDFDQEPLTIVAATELKDLEGLVGEASEDLGFPIELEFPAGTLANSQSLKSGEFDGTKDATWFATNRYVDLIGADHKLANETSIATSPVAFGVWEDASQRLGWNNHQPTWSEFGEAAGRKEFSFGMTDPNSSNSGFSSLLSVATALADTGQALSYEDIDRIVEPMAQLYQAQEMVSGSSGWLADTFVNNPGEVDAIINYESNLHQLREEGHPITVIVPADGVISADYPLSTLAQPKGAQAGQKVEALVEWLMEHQQEIANTYRRPVGEVDELPAPVREQLAIELAFPSERGIVEELLHVYNNGLRAPGSTTFVLDTSGSMDGERLDSLKDIMHSLIDGSASTETGNVGLRDNELVSLLAFSDEPYSSVTVTFGHDNPQSIRDLSAYVDGLVGVGDTALYQALLQALEEADTDHGIPSIVLLSDGLVTRGPDYQGFVDAYGHLPEEIKDIPVFIILYGEASAEEMEDLAELTGGAVFDALNGDLHGAFKEIRGYQ